MCRMYQSTRTVRCAAGQHRARGGRGLWRAGLRGQGCVATRRLIRAANPRRHKRLGGYSVGSEAAGAVCSVTELQFGRDVDQGRGKSYRGGVSAAVAIMNDSGDVCLTPRYCRSTSPKLPCTSFYHGVHHRLNTERAGPGRGQCAVIHRTAGLLGRPTSRPQICRSIAEMTGCPLHGT